MSHQKDRDGTQSRSIEIIPPRPWNPEFELAPFKSKVQPSSDWATEAPRVAREMKTNCLEIANNNYKQVWIWGDLYCTHSMWLEQVSLLGCRAQADKWTPIRDGQSHCGQRRTDRYHIAMSSSYHNRERSMEMKTKIVIWYFVRVRWIYSLNELYKRGSLVKEFNNVCSLILKFVRIRYSLNGLYSIH